VLDALGAILMWLDSGASSQIPSHSFWLAGQQLPLGARDLGLFGGFLLASALVPHTERAYIWLLGLAPLVLDGANSFAADALGVALYADNNILRLATGLLAGACVVPALAVRPFPSLTPWWPTSQAGACLRRARNSTPRPGAGADVGNRGGSQQASLIAIGIAVAAALRADPGAGLTATPADAVVASIIATIGVLGMLATANLLARPMSRRSAWLLALPELAGLALMKQGALALLS
jgi:uncharacterized membrane protein